MGWLKKLAKIIRISTTIKVASICLAAFFVMQTGQIMYSQTLPTNLSYSTETTWLLPGSPHLSATAGYIPHTFSQNETVLTLNNETIHGLQTGQDYPELSIRSMAWSLSTAQYYYPDEYLREPIEAFLRQRPGQSGLISTDDTPTATLADAELNLIHAAYLYYNLSYNTTWLNSTVGRRSVIARLNQAADWIYSQRLDANHQLLWRNGSNLWPSTNTTTNEKIFAIYDQALAYLVFLELAQMNAAGGDTTQADRWQHNAEQLKTQTNALLWQAESGLYRSQLDNLAATNPNAGNESIPIAITNALAIYAGLTDNRQTEPIFEQLEQARLAAGANKPGLSIYPPYVESGSYSNTNQNNTIWDWWGGLQIKSEFLGGQSHAARQHLQQIANEWQQHPGNIIEWQAVNTYGKEGSHYHSATAGSVGSAIIEGLFGVTLDGGGLTLQPRLGLNDGYVRVYQAATDRYAAYSYDWGQDITRLDYGTNVDVSILVKVLILPSEQVNTVLVDGHSTPFHNYTIGQDTYISFTAPQGEHQIELTKGSGQDSTIEQTISASDTAVLPSIAHNIDSPPSADISAATQANLSTPTESVTERYARQTQQELINFASATLIIIVSLILIGLVILRRFTDFGQSTQPPQ